MQESLIETKKEEKYYYPPKNKTSKTRTLIPLFFKNWNIQRVRDKLRAFFCKERYKIQN